MRSHPFMQVDAFTRTPLAGNACAVVFDADDLDESTMLAIAREMNLSETAFVVRSAVADVGARYFTPVEEIPLAGHPTVATVFALVESGRVPLTGDVTRIRLELPAGTIPIEIRAENGRVRTIVMSQMRPAFLATYRREDVLPVFGLAPDDAVADLPIQTVSTGTPQLMVPLRDLDALRRARLDVAAYERLRERGDFFSPHLFCARGVQPPGRTFARHFGVPPDTMEDPFTGSATGGMAAYLWRYGVLDTPTFTAQQGHWMNRPGEAMVEVVGPRESIETVKVGGPAVLVLQGELAPGGTQGAPAPDTPTPGQTTFDEIAVIPPATDPLEVRVRHEANRAGWNEGAAHYTETLDAALVFLREGRSNLHPIERRNLGDLRSWCRVAIHLQCASGRDTLSLWNEGVERVVGVDISDVHIENARRLTRELNAPATWYRCDVLDTPAELDGTADLVYTGRGALCWLQDLDAWARVVHRLLRPGGVFHVLDDHPVTWLFDASRETLVPTSIDYFGYAETSKGWSPTYIGDLGRPVSELASKYERLWPVSFVFEALAGAGLVVERLGEHPDEYWDAFPRLPPALKRRMPMTFSMLARRPVA